MTQNTRPNQHLAKLDQEGRVALPLLVLYFCYSSNAARTNTPPFIGAAVYSFVVIDCVEHVNLHQRFNGTLKSINAASVVIQRSSFFPLVTHAS